MMKRIAALGLLLAAALLAACADAQRSGVPTEVQAAGASPTSQPSGSAAPLASEEPATADSVAALTTTEVDELAPTDTSAPTATPRRNRRVDMAAITNYPKYVPFDGILPIYDPEFVPAAEAPFEDDELVLAIALEGEARAYPITVLRGREMVNDELAGTPILATW